MAVLDQLINHRFDILHYCGHCFFNAADPPRSGWLFNGTRNMFSLPMSLAASTACRGSFSRTPANRASPPTALRREMPCLRRASPKRSSPAAFRILFAPRGPWTMRQRLPLRGASTAGCLAAGQASPESAHEAMAAARQEIATKHGRGGLQTWGAYQHYGDPNFRIVAPGTPPTSGKAKGQRTRPPGKTRGSGRRDRPSLGS